MSLLADFSEGNISWSLGLWRSKCLNGSDLSEVRWMELLLVQLVELTLVLELVLINQSTSGKVQSARLVLQLDLFPCFHAEALHEDMLDEINFTLVLQVQHAAQFQMAEVRLQLS